MAGNAPWQGRAQHATQCKHVLHPIPPPACQQFFCNEVNLFCWDLLAPSAALGALCIPQRLTSLPDSTTPIKRTRTPAHQPLLYPPAAIHRQQDLAAKEAEIKEHETSAAQAAADFATQRARRDELMNRQKALFKEDTGLEG